MRHFSKTLALATLMSLAGISAAQAATFGSSVDFGPKNSMHIAIGQAGSVPAVGYHGPALLPILPTLPNQGPICHLMTPDGKICGNNKQLWG